MLILYEAKRTITGSIALIPYSTSLRRTLYKRINMFQSIGNFKTSYMLTANIIQHTGKHLSHCQIFELFCLLIKFNYYKNSNFLITLLKT